MEHLDERFAEMWAADGITWDEARHVPMLADHECSGCGEIVGHRPTCPRLDPVPVLIAARQMAEELLELAKEAAETTTAAAG